MARARTPYFVVARVQRVGRAAANTSLKGSRSKRRHQRADLGRGALVPNAQRASFCAPARSMCAPPPPFVTHASAPRGPHWRRGSTSARESGRQVEAVQHGGKAPVGDSLIGSGPSEKAIRAPRFPVIGGTAGLPFRGGWAVGSCGLARKCTVQQRRRRSLRLPPLSFGHVRGSGVSKRRTRPPQIPLRASSSSRLVLASCSRSPAADSAEGGGETTKKRRATPDHGARISCNGDASGKWAVKRTDIGVYS